MMSQSETLTPSTRWTDGLNRYHYLVLMVACFGWMFDTMDQWLYVQAKTPAIMEVLTLRPPKTEGVADRGTQAVALAVEANVTAPIPADQAKAAGDKLAVAIAAELGGAGIHTQSAAIAPALEKTMGKLYKAASPPPLA